MGALAGDVCSCDQPGGVDSNDKRIKELVRATVDEAIKASKKPDEFTDFVLGSSYGVLLWGMLGNLLVIWLVNICCKASQIVGFKDALCKIKLLKYLNDQLMQRTPIKDGGGSPAAADPPSDHMINEAARSLAAAAGIGNALDSNSSDIQQKEEEMNNRESTSKSLLAACYKKLRKLKNPTKDDIHKLPTHCTPSTSTARSPVDPANSCSAPSPNKHISVGVHLDKKLTEKEEMELFTSTTSILDIDSQNITMQSGSIFLSADIHIQPSGMVDLFDRAERLVKMGFRFDPACTVQLGAAALLYTTSGENVKTKLLEQGDVPIITSVQRFYTKTIMIKGCYLKDAEIKASRSPKKSVCLNVIYYQALDEGLEVLFAQIPQDEILCEKTVIYANKSIRIEGYEKSLVLRSISKKIDIHKHPSTLLGTLGKTKIWITLSLLCIYQAMVLKVWRMPRMEWVFQLITSVCCLVLVEYIIGPWTFYIITCLIQYMMQSTNLDNILVLKEISKKAFDSTYTSSERATNTRDSRHTSRRKKHTSRRKNPSLSFLLGGNHSHRESESSGEDSGSNSEDNIDTDSTKTARVDEGNVNDENWEWPCYERVWRNWRWVKELVDAKASKNESFDDVGKTPFELVTTLDENGGVRKVHLIVHSPLLIQVLKECEPKTDAEFRAGSSIDPKEIFCRREALRACVDKSSERMKNVQLSTADVWHVKHVLRFMERHFAEVLEKYERMKAERCVSYDMLWAFFMPGDGVCRRCLLTDQECFATVNSLASYNEEDYNCSLRLNVMDFNVRRYHKCTIIYRLDGFKGEVPFDSLKVWPLHLFPNRIKDMENRFIFVGDIFYQVAMQQPFCFRQFKGSINFYVQLESGCWGLHKLNADGRVMIDLLSFARMNPNYPLGDAMPPCEVMVGTWTPEPGHMKRPSDEELKMAPAFAYGFSFGLKKWGCFELCGLREINFNEGAFEALRMTNENQKRILWSVVQQYTASESRMQNDNDQSIDPIANKGRGCIVLCHGPPGTGKTLTAEALAETQRRPLWAISAFELGDEADKVEKSLGQILEIAHLWRSVLLLDEADAYLERRGEGVDVKRNLLTGVFLRVLEYYRGIMFLTTNRVTAFDDAILSRITLAISYPPLDDRQRRAIWERLLLKHTSINVDATSLEPLLQLQLNGREIRNIVRLAQILAHAHGRPLQISDVFSAVDAGTKALPL